MNAREAEKAPSPPPTAARALILARPKDRRLHVVRQVDEDGGARKFSLSRQGLVPFLLPTLPAGEP